MFSWNNDFVAYLIQHLACALSWALFAMPPKKSVATQTLLIRPVGSAPPQTLQSSLWMSHSQLVEWVRTRYRPANPQELRRIVEEVKAESVLRETQCELQWFVPWDVHQSQ